MITTEEALQVVAKHLGSNPAHRGFFYEFPMPYKPGDHGPSGFSFGVKWFQETLEEVNSYDPEDLPKILSSQPDGHMSMVKRVLLQHALEGKQ